MLASVWARAEVRHLAQGGFQLELKLDIRATPEQVYRHLVQDVGSWWPSDHTYSGNAANMYIEAEPEGCFCEKWGENGVRHLTVAFVAPGRTLRMLGGLGPLQEMGLDGALTVSLEAADPGTKLTLRYNVSGYAPAGFDQLAPIVDRVLAQQFNGLKSFVEKKVSSGPRDGPVPAVP